MGGVGSGGKGFGGPLLVPTRSADNTPAADEVVRADDLASMPDRDSRVRARLAELQDFKVRACTHLPFVRGAAGMMHRIRMVASANVSFFCGCESTRYATLINSI
jgi:hypothetical protein